MKTPPSPNLFKNGSIKPDDLVRSQNSGLFYERLDIAA
jgi:hypothetical protein